MDLDKQHIIEWKEALAKLQTKQHATGSIQTRCVCKCGNTFGGPGSENKTCEAIGTLKDALNKYDEFLRYLLEESKKDIDFEGIGPFAEERVMEIGGFLGEDVSKFISDPTKDTVPWE